MRLLWVFCVFVQFPADAVNICDVYEALATPQWSHANMEATDSVDTKQVGPNKGNYRLLTMLDLVCNPCFFTPGSLCMLYSISEPFIVINFRLWINCFGWAIYLFCILCASLHHLYMVLVWCKGRRATSEVFRMYQDTF